MKKIILVISTLLIAAGAYAQVSEEDFQALREIYETMGGKNWTNNSGWNFKKCTAADVKKYDKETGEGWWGITEIRDGRVGKLDLRENNVCGSFSPAFYKLTRLRSLNLEKNRITGSLSSRIADLDRLALLILSDNQMSGPIPAEIVLMGRNAKTSAPKADGKGGNEIKVRLNKNKFSGSIPENIGDMALLHKPSKSTSLDLGYNELTGELPQSLLKLTEVTSIKAAKNHLTGIVPEGLADLPKLKYLDLRKNNFTGDVPQK